MERKQRTIRASQSCQGVGLHTGVKTTITFHPAPENFGIRFIRSDIPGCIEIKADIDHVVDISRGTTIEENDVRIHTVEHALAAVSGLRLDNILIELTGKEPPVMDGSAKDFVECLIKAGIKIQNEQRKVLEITRAVNYTNSYRDIDIHVIPSDRFRITFMVEYNLPALGSQYEAIYNMEEDFAFEVAPARTFCFLSEVEMLKERGLIQGGSLDSAVVIVDKEIDQLEIDRIKDLFGIEDDINELLKNFGIAITTTLVGLIGRIILSQFRESLDEMKEKSERQISDSARKLNTQLVQSIDILRNQSTAISKNTDKALQDSSSSLRRYMVENSKILQESTEKSKNVIEEFNRQASDITRKISRINIPADKFEKFQESVDDIVKTLNNLESGLKKSSAESEIHKVTENFRSLNALIKSQSKLLNDEFANSKDVLDNLTKNLVGVAKFISENLKKK